MRKLLARTIGGGLVFIGLIGMLTPIPFGIFFFIAGLMFLIPTTPAVTNMVRKARRRVRPFDRMMSYATNRAPYPYRRILRETEIQFSDY